MYRRVHAARVISISSLLSPFLCSLNFGFDASAVFFNSVYSFFGKFFSGSSFVTLVPGGTGLSLSVENKD